MRAAQGVRPTTTSTVNGREIVDDGMVFFWQCQASRAGKVECGAFKILDIKAEGRGPCMADPGPDDEPDDPSHEPDRNEEPKVESEIPAGPVCATKHVSGDPKQGPETQPAEEAVKEEAVKEEAVRDEPVTTC